MHNKYIQCQQWDMVCKQLCSIISRIFLSGGPLVTSTIEVGMINVEKNVLLVML